MQELIDKYTRSLYNIINIDKTDIWKNSNFVLPDFVNIDKIKEMFNAEYLYNEIGVETVGQFMTRLDNKVLLLNDKYTKLFNAFNIEFTNNDIYANNIGEFLTSSKLYRTPQTQINQVGNYLTEQQDNEGNEQILRGMTKAEAREIYVDKLRNIYYEYIQEFKDLFMKIY